MVKNMVNTYVAILLISGGKTVVRNVKIEPIPMEKRTVQINLSVNVLLANKWTTASVKQSISGKKMKRIDFFIHLIASDKVERTFDGIESFIFAKKEETEFFRFIDFFIVNLPFNTR